MAIAREQLNADRAALRVRWQQAGYFRGRTVSTALNEAAAKHSSTRFHFYTESGYVAHDLATLNERSLAVARGLARAGMRRGEVLAVQMPLVAETVILYMAAAHLGAVALPIIHSYGPAELTAILAAGKARALAIPSIWRGADYPERVASATLPATLDLFIVAGKTDKLAGRVVEFDTLAAPAANVELAPADPQDDALLIFSSGTTGVPKGIRHSNESILADYEIRFFANEGPFLNVMPTGHIAALICIFEALVHGVDLVCLDRWDPALAAELIERHRVTQSGGVPAMMMGVLEAAARDHRDLSSLRSFKLGGTGVTPQHVKMAQDAGITAGRFYGLSEHPTVTICDDAQSFEQRGSTDGIPCEGTEVRIVDDDAREVPVGVDGEIVTRGPELFIGYTDPELDLEYFLPGGWFRTGDIGHLDAAGCLTITDRKKDIIIRGGENISPKEIEGLLLEHPAIADVAVVGYPDERMGERVCAVIKPREGSQVSLADITQHLLARGIAKFKLPERVMFVDALPLNQNGKVQKDVLRQRLRHTHGGSQ